MAYFVSLHHWWTGGVTFLIALATHFALWRLLPVRREVWTLCAILLLLPAFLYGLAGGAVAAFLLHFALAANYIAIYPVLQASSPTIHMLNTLRRSPDGLTREELRSAMERLAHVEARIADLVTGGLVREREGELRLSRPGKWLADLFIVYRRVIGLEQGKG